MAKYVKVTTDSIKNFLASDVGLRLVTYQFANTGISADSLGKKIIPAGTIVGSGSGAKGIVFEAVDVTEGEHEGALIVGGHIINDQLPTAASATEITALNKLGIFFDAASDKVARAGITELGYTIEADTDNTNETFTASDIATDGDGLTLTATAANSSDTAKATVAVSAGTVTVTPVANGACKINVTLTDSLGSSYVVAVDCTVSNQS